MTIQLNIEERDGELHATLNRNGNVSLLKVPMKEGFQQAMRTIMDMVVYGSREIDYYLLENQDKIKPFDGVFDTQDTD